MEQEATQGGCHAQQMAAVCGWRRAQQSATFHSVPAQCSHKARDNCKVWSVMRCSRHAAPLGAPGSSLALLHSHSSGRRTNPAFTGLLWIYSLAELKCRSSRMKRSQYSRCQTRCTAFDPGDDGSRDERCLPVKDFHDATVRAIVQPSIGWKRTWTWFGMTTQANNRYRIPSKHRNASWTRHAAAGSRSRQHPCPASINASICLRRSASCRTGGTVRRSSSKRLRTPACRLSARWKVTC